VSSVERVKLLLVAGMVIVANVLDLLSTYVASPDLTQEWNILHREFGLGWSGLITAKVIGGLAAVVGYAYYLQNRTLCYPPLGMSCLPFYRHIVANEINLQNANERDPHFWQRILVTLGYLWAGMQFILFWVALDNILLVYGIQCELRFYTELGYHMLQGVIIASLVLYRFYFINYSRYVAILQCPARQSMR
jgi:hypothetical protein